MVYFDAAESLATSRAAVDSAEALGDPALLVETWNAFTRAATTQLQVDEVPPAVARMRAVGDLLDSPEIGFLAHGRGASAALVAGDLLALDDRRAACACVAAGLRSPYFHYAPAFMRAARALHVGDRNAAESLAEDAFVIGRRGALSEARVVYDAQRWEIAMAGAA